MWMELQGTKATHESRTGKKATHDFLSLYAQDSSVQLQEPRPPPSQGFILKTHDFLRPLERAEEGSGEAATGSSRSGSVEHVLPGGIGTYSISHVPGYGSLVAAVKAERDTCSAKTPERKPEPSGSRGTYSGGGGFTLWEESTARETGSRGQWPPPSSAAARGSASFGSLSSLRHRHRHYSAEQDKKRLMESPSNPMRGFHDEEEDEFGKREASAAAQRVELMVTVDEKGSDLKQPSTLRSKHSATEQRRRSKINDRFQILRDLIPHSDQKRDKASFLLEVIEYIRFLQEKVQKYDTLYPACDQETSKLTPWKNSQGPGAGIRDPSPVTQNGTAAPGFMFSGNDNSTSVVPAMPTEFDICASGSYKSLESAPGFLCKGAAMPAPLEANLYTSAGREASFTQPQQTLITDSVNLASESQPQWPRSSCLAECTVSNQANEHEELTIDEGTISVSNVYSQGLLTALSQTLHSSGIDLSQARISVQINLGKQAIRRPTATTPMSSAKDHGHPFPGSHAMGHSRVGSSGEESEHATKRHKPDNS